MSFPRYPEYKDSGVEWLGVLPCTWAVSELKYLAEYRSSNVDKKSVDGQEPIRLCNYTDVYYNDLIIDEMDLMQATASADQIERFSLKDGDVIITKDSETADDIAVPALVPKTLHGVICGYHLAMIRPRRHAHGPYLKWLFDSNYIRSCVAVRANGLTRVGLGYSEVTGLELPVPSLEEQRSIAAFLGRETGKIDELVAEQRRLIELLKEKRQAVISHAVTQGLNPNAPRKPSGIPWLGNVPEHWEVKPLKAIALHQSSNVDKKTVEGQAEVLLCNYTDVYYKEEINEDLRLMKATATLEQIDKFTLRAGDVIITKDSETADDIAVSAYVPHDLPGVICGYHLAMLRPMQLFAGRYLKRLFDSTYVKAMVCVRANGLTRVGLGQEALNSLHLPVPPFEEQILIAEFMERECGIIAQLTDDLALNTEKLHERRTALISAAVTGKIDVRNAVGEEVAA